ncbi:glycosyltransferase [Variovorax paradoxus]|uniref:glycosyltransferase n=1 Tax=Variovorax paradoxus TaxID=34073 RepID=UPI0028556A3E|nr:glycosyltransferase [Variovorax paradoxus]MDR6454220.1 glycosyltransferase involved in cell wall biosynthesis [Variovorax paradoxus]
MKYLVITATFAPRGTSAAVRLVHMVKYLSELGHEVQVLTYDDSTLTLFSAEDAALSRKVPASVVVTRIPGGPLRRHFFKGSRNGGSGATAAKNRYKRNPLISLLVPDPHVDSVPGFIRAGDALIKQYRPDVVVTHGYPFSMHWVGTALKRRFPQVLWMADYGDPWVSTPVSELPRPAWRKWLDLHLEKRWLRRADLVTVTTAPTKALYESQFSFLKGKVDVIAMGYDPDDFLEIPPLTRPQTLEGKLLLVHTGRIYPQARDPEPFVRAMEKLALEAPNLFDAVRVVLVGEGDDHVKQLIRGSVAEQAFVFIPWVPVAESIAWMKAADWVLLFGNKGGVQIPGKVYQYIGSGRPIFMTLLDKGDPTADIVHLAQGSMVLDSTVEQLFGGLKRMLIDRPSTKTEGSSSDSKLAFGWPSLMAHLAGTVRSLHADIGRTL